VKQPRSKKRRRDYALRRKRGKKRRNSTKNCRGTIQKMEERQLCSLEKRKLTTVRRMKYLLLLKSKTRLGVNQVFNLDDQMPSLSCIFTIILHWLLVVLVEHWWMKSIDNLKSYPLNWEIGKKYLLLYLVCNKPKNGDIICSRFGNI